MASKNLQKLPNIADSCLRWQFCLFRVCEGRGGSIKELPAAAVRIIITLLQMGASASWTNYLFATRVCWGPHFLHRDFAREFFGLTIFISSERSSLRYSARATNPPIEIFTQTMPQLLQISTTWSAILKPSYVPVDPNHWTNCWIRETLWQNLWFFDI